jgi:hypothetical protein
MNLKKLNLVELDFQSKKEVNGGTTPPFGSIEWFKDLLNPTGPYNPQP